MSTSGLPMSYKLGPHWGDVITWSDFNSGTSFGFRSPNYTGQCTCFFVKPKKTVSFDQFSRFLFFVSVSYLTLFWDWRFELKLMF